MKKKKKKEKTEKDILPNSTPCYMTAKLWMPNWQLQP